MSNFNYCESTEDASKEDSIYLLAEEEGVFRMTELLGFSRAIRLDRSLSLIDLIIKCVKSILSGFYELYGLVANGSLFAFKTTEKGIE